MDKGERNIELEASDLPQPYKKYADTIGMENFIKLSELIGGRNIYLPSPDSLLISPNRKKIVSEYRAGTSVKELADKYKISSESIYRYIKRYRDIR